MTRISRLILHCGCHAPPRVALASTAFAAAMLCMPSGASAQRDTSSTHVRNSASSSTDASVILRQVLPSDVAARVLARIAAARAHGLPADALQQRALKFAARGIPAADIERSVAAHAERMAHAKQALERGRQHPSTGDEIEAGAEAMREGVDGHLISALAKSAPSGRSLAVSLYVIGSLTARGLPSDQASARVEARLLAHASDDDLESLLSTVAEGPGTHAGDHDASVGVGAGHHGADGTTGAGAGVGVGAGGAVGAGVGGAPAGVPGNGGATVRPPTGTLPIGTHSHH